MSQPQPLQLAVPVCKVQRALQVPEGVAAAFQQCEALQVRELRDVTYGDGHDGVSFGDATEGDIGQGVARVQLLDRGEYCEARFEACIVEQRDPDLGAKRPLLGSPFPEVYRSDFEVEEAVSKVPEWKKAYMCVTPRSL